jgi:hypothetical protein
MHFLLDLVEDAFSPLFTMDKSVKGTFSGIGGGFWLYSSAGYVWSWLFERFNIGGPVLRSRNGLSQEE